MNLIKKNLSECINRTTEVFELVKNTKVKAMKILQMYIINNMNVLNNF